VGVLENALRASGGVDLRRLTRRLTVHMSITGDLCSTSDLKQHFLIEDRSLLTRERFEKFIERRRAMLLDVVRDFLGR
jgi:hypothetical protein